MLFADRLEVWNPGHLPSSLTLDSLRRPHASVPRNPLIADPLFLTRYIERAGSGILDMIALCREAGLPAPEFRQESGQFIQTIWRHWLTTTKIAELGLNDRQRQAVGFLRLHQRITNKDYRELSGATDRTALRDLAELQGKGVLAKRGQTGRSAHYVLTSKPDINPTNPTSGSPAKPAKNPTNPTSPPAVNRGNGLTKGSKKSTTPQGSQEAHDQPLPRKSKDQPK
jgi:predicted HTH transcriptional regulator